MPLTYTIGNGADALLFNQLAAGLRGSYWSSGVDASPGTNAMEVDLTSGEVSVQTTSVSVAAQTVTLASADSDPRKDVIYIDSNGDAQVLTGTAAASDPSGEVREDTFVPEPPDASGVTGVVVAEVWVPAGASDITTSDIRDRRLSNQAVSSAGAWVDSGSDNQLGGDIYTLASTDDGIEIGTVTIGREATIGGSPMSAGVSQKDVSVAFDGTDDETVSLTNTFIYQQSISLDKAGTTVDRGADTEQDSFDRTGARGIEINPNVDMDGVILEVSSQTQTVTEVGVADVNGNRVGSTTGTFSSGDQVTVIASLSSGTTYYAYAYDGGNNYKPGEHPNAGYPDTSNDIDITNGAYSILSSPSTDPTARCIRTVTAYFMNNSGSATIEWPSPQAIHNWGIATFTKTLDGATANVFVAYSTDGGSTWTRTNGGVPISRDYNLRLDGNISPTDDVRFEIELSRTDVSNKPTVDSVARTWQL